MKTKGHAASPRSERQSASPASKSHDDHPSTQLFSPLLHLLLLRSTIALHCRLHEKFQALRRILSLHHDLHHLEALLITKLLVLDKILQLAPILHPPRRYRIFGIILRCAEIVRRFEIPPWLDVIVAGLHAVNEPFDSVSVVVDDEDRDVQSIPDDVGDGLRSHLEGAVAFEQNRSTLWLGI